MSLQDLLLQPWIYGPLVSVAAVAVLLFVKRRVFRIVRVLAARTETRIDDILLDASGRPLTLFIIASGLQLLGRLLPLTQEADRVDDLAYKGVVILSLVWFVDRLAR